jgi:hypothetical protein
MNCEDRFNIFEELQAWCKTLENWEQVAVLILWRKSSVDDKDLERIYEEFKYDKGLTQPPQDRNKVALDFSFIPKSLEQSKPLILSKICETKGINAIVNGEELCFGPKLTVIYGPNGSGKSAYAK